MKTAAVGWACFLGFLALSPRWLPGRWERYAVPVGEMVNVTDDCKVEAPRETIEISERNAALIAKHGFRQVLVSASDGCYRLNDERPLAAIKRDPESLEIVSREAQGQVRVTMVISLPYGQLPSGMREYALGKFHARAPYQRYQLITLAKISEAEND